MSSLTYLAGYPPQLQAQARALLEKGELGPLLASKYPQAHEIRTSKALYSYVQELKSRHLRKAPPLGRVHYDDKMHVVHNALGLNVAATHVQGSKLRKRRELRVASVFKEAPASFLRMIVVHELAHLKHTEHDRDFYKLCVHMEPEYHQLEFDMRLFLTLRERDE
jgi:UTP pyrophosphatase